MRRSEEGPLSDEERLEQIEEVLERLSELSHSHILLVEGVNDVRALNALGIFGDMFMMQSSGGPVRAVEYLEEHGGKAVLLTDWDRRGDSLAEQIKGMTAGSNGIDYSIRKDLSRLCGRFIFDVESLDSLVKRLRSA